MDFFPCSKTKAVGGLPINICVDNNRLPAEKWDVRGDILFRRGKGGGNGRRGIQDGNYALYSTVQYCTLSAST
jgi:hypothetical protein